ncbi:BamA/TamA family outer membrane protein [Romeria aff. gracilis LEGE 07310]|uniref:BamA/TamA family outer membrane protein n=1 Tax=Vasconcelosia minhoensis LEGE 07310 TaxID=915328 RepID=A0A8J7AF42_9CYAN|nr:BamA/TamA family outer membrane protein [Romeria gracilis]MBE9076303.1 BamA/TamA family outer membrane protein [Romeria aff. gracilis LEGE 07310]
MRVSPALLACCTLSAIAALSAPAQASPSGWVESPTQLAQTPESPAESDAPTESPEEPAAEPDAEVIEDIDEALEDIDEDVDVIETDDAVPDTGAGDVIPGPGGEQDGSPALEIEIDGDDPADPPSFEEEVQDAIEEAQPEVPPGEPEAPQVEPTEPGEDAVEQVPEETRVLVSEVAVASATNEPLTDELIDAVYRAAQTEPGRTATRSQLQADINNIFGTGFFSNVEALPEDTPLGVRVTFLVDPNPVLTEVDVRETQVLPQEVVDEIFAPQYGEVLNLIDLQDGIVDLNQWYQDNGYVLAQVTAAPQISDSGVVTLIVAEGVIESFEVRYITPDGDTVDEDGEPVDGRTRPFIVTREFETQPGDVFQQQQIQEDLRRAFNLGIFDDIRLSLDPGDEDPRQVKVNVNIAERNTGSVGAAVGFNLAGDIFGQVSYNQDNFGGNNQKLRAEGQVSLAGDFLFDVSFTDPWIAGDPFRTSYTTRAFNSRSISLIFDNGETEVELPNGDTPRINRWGGSLSFNRPLDNGWSASLGTGYERVAVVDSDGDLSPEDELGNDLSFSGSGRDDLLTVQFGVVQDLRNSNISPTSGSVLRLGTEQSIPVGNGSILFNRIRGSYSYYIPVDITGFGDGPEALAFNVQAGTVVGDLPPYEAFSLGGVNSVRGYDEGEVGSGRSFLQATAEYRFPLFTSFLGGALFLDAATDLGTGSSVPGNPAGVRDKPGSGFGYGVGLRVQTPLGALRLDYGLNDQGDSQIHFGFGERF